jgi:mannose-1-phosphate guanylyltransferase
MNDSTKRRLAENEVICRQANEKVNQHVLKDEELAAYDKLKLHFFCECSRRDCSSRIAMTAAEYATAHQDNRHFIVIPSHDTSEIEQVVRHGDGYDVVEKYEDPDKLLAGRPATA